VEGVEFVDRVHGDQCDDCVIGVIAKEADIVVLEEGMRAQEPLKRRLPFVAGPVDKIVGFVRWGDAIGPAIDSDTKEKEILHRANDAGRDYEG
jgi:hypothetical protein